MTHVAEYKAWKRLRLTVDGVLLLTRVTCGRTLRGVRVTPGETKAYGDE